MKRLILTLIAALCCMAGSAQPRKISAGEGFAGRLASLSSQIETISCDFTQVRHVSVIAGDVCQSGRFYYKREGNICLEFTSPAGDMIVMDGKKFKIVTMGRQNIVEINSNPMLRQMGSVLSACMTGDIKMLESGSDAEYFEDGDTYVVTISPKNKRAKSHIGMVTLTFDKKDMSLSQMRMDEPSGDYTEYLFVNKKFNAPVDDLKFKI